MVIELHPEIYALYRIECKYSTRARRPLRGLTTRALDLIDINAASTLFNGHHQASIFPTLDQDRYHSKQEDNNSRALEEHRCSYVWRSTLALLIHP